MRGMCALALGGLLAGQPAYAAALLHDDFNGPALSSVWAQGTWMLGRTQLGAPLSFSNDSGVSFVTLALHTYNPHQPGMSLYGAEIYSARKFARDMGLLVEARVRQRTETRGLISSLFGYEYLSNVADEIDFEFLSNRSSNQVLVTQWNDWDYTGANGSRFNDNIHHHSVLVTNGLLNRRQWTTLRYLWLPTETAWEANGSELHRTAAALPNAPMPARANFWAANTDWLDAYDSALQPATTPAQDQVWFYDIDYITVAAIPETATLTGCGMLCCALWRARHTTRKIHHDT